MSATAERAAAGLPDLLYGEAETELRPAVRSLLDDRCAWPDVLARTETAQTYDAGLWRVLAADLGAAGLLIPEASRRPGAPSRVRSASCLVMSSDTTGSSDTPASRAGTAYRP